MPEDLSCLLRIWRRRLKVKVKKDGGPLFQGPPVSQPDSFWRAQNYMELLGSHRPTIDVEQPPKPGVCMASWRRLHQAALSENDTNELLRLVHGLESALVKRSEELAHDPHSEELREIQVAVADLLSIKINKLGWPDPR